MLTHDAHDILPRAGLSIALRERTALLLDDLARAVVHRVDDVLHPLHARDGRDVDDLPADPRGQERERVGELAQDFDRALRGAVIGPTSAAAAEGPGR